MEPQVRSSPSEVRPQEGPHTEFCTHEDVDHSVNYTAQRRRWLSAATNGTEQAAGAVDSAVLARTLGKPGRDP